jgi:hypothetical protein
MGFPGRFHASSAPTVAKAAMNTTPTTPSSPLPAWLASFAGSGYRALDRSPAADVTTVTAQIDHARQNAGAAICHLSSFVFREPRYGLTVPASLRRSGYLMATALAGEPIPPGALSGALTRNIS